MTYTPGTIAESVLYTLSTVTCGLYILISLVGRRRHDIRKRGLTLQLLYMTCLTCFFGVRVFFLLYYSSFVLLGSNILDFAGYIALVGAKLLALCLWYECGLALTAAASQSPSPEGMLVLKQAQRRFRFLVGMYMLVFFVADVSLNVWIAKQADWKPTTRVIQDGKFLLSEVVSAYFLVANYVFLGLACVVVGLRMGRKARKYQRKYTSDMRKLKQLSVGAVVICVSFWIKAGMSVALVNSGRVASYCIQDVATYQVCYSAYFFATEWAPNIYFVTLLFVFSFVNNGGGGQAGKQQQQQQHDDMVAPLVEMSHGLHISR